MAAVTNERTAARAKAFRGRAKVHTVTITVRFDAEVNHREARYAVWDALHGYEIFGNGKPAEIGYRSQEPFGRAVVHVKR